MIYLIVFRIFINILKVLTVYYFSPIHTFTSYIIVKMFNLLLRKDTEYKYFSLIPFVFQLLALLIFLEIIEINFCDLDKNTKRNIEKRQFEENLKLLNQEIIDDDDDEKESIEVSPGYIIETEMEKSSEGDNEN